MTCSNIRSVNKYFYAIFFILKNKACCLANLILHTFFTIGMLACISVFSLWRCCPQRATRPPHFWGFWITSNDASQSVGLLWTSDRPVAETSTWQHTTLTTDKHPRPRRDSNPQSQQASRRRPTPYTARSLLQMYCKLITLAVAIIHLYNYAVLLHVAVFLSQS